MAYGRLDVFWPDGKLESFTLNTPSVSVGRSTGNTIVLDTDAVSRYHFSITQDGDRVHLTDLDSANGTFIDGVRLASNKAHPLLGGEEIQVGALRMIFHTVDDQPTLPVAAAEDTQRIERETAGFKVEVFGAEMAVPPGSHIAAEIAITSMRQEPTRFTVRAGGLPESWMRINRPELEIDPDESALVLLSIKPARQSDSRPGKYPVRIVVTPKDDTEGAIEVEITVHILPFAGFGMALANYKITTGQHFRLHLHNQGSADLPLLIAGNSPDEELRFGIPTTQVLLPPGQRKVIQGEIRPRHPRLIGPVIDHPFELIVRSRDRAAFLASIPGKFIEKPVLPVWAALSSAALAVGVTILTILAVALALRGAGARPSIQSFQAASTQVARGDLLGLSWAVADAEHLNINVNGARLFSDISPETTRIDLETSSYEGSIVVVLEAVSGSRVDTASVTVTIGEPLAVEYFEVTPDTLVRNVVQTLNIRWRVTNASTTRVVGLDRFITTPVEPSYGEEGTLTGLAGIATDSFTLTLHAEDLLGNTLEQDVFVTVVNPECTPNADATLYALTDSTSNVVGTASAGTPLIVDRQDDTRAWLRFVLPGDVFGWAPRSAFTCASNFNPEDLRIEVVSPTPAPTP